MARLGFAWWVLTQRFRNRGWECPYCKSTFSTFMQSKKILIQARKCSHCGLIFRFPADSAAKAAIFYNEKYQEGEITHLPSSAEISRLKADNFNHSVYDKSGYIDLLRKTQPAPCSLLDFGASWGYLAYQAAQCGYASEGFEVSANRASFGRRELGITIHTSWETISGDKYDLLFAAHVMEHLHNPWMDLDQMARVLKKNGKLVIVLPNGGGLNARRLGVKWGPFLGESHVAAFTPHWFRSNLWRHGFFIERMFSSPNDFSCDGDELVCVAVKK